MPDFESHEFDIGAHFLSALIDGDVTGLSDAEERQLDEWERETRATIGDVSGLGHWQTVDGHSDEFGVCDVTGLRSETERVVYMAPITGSNT